ncbi:apolipoprotein N-acyltransferase [Alteromonas sp. a30]|uniref:apolipoprotein N-acyltransferase n=1 Tax=Alteromonas sp. a30 TaxID=2730917 RepID=UPI002281511D|nr:apolipoprotein N-acyltransferase [Alteromonas sp. a30]MCY7295828.1 apolipoprotein N-acyltransferase [Alteromonas sp. a30]
MKHFERLISLLLGASLTLAYAPFSYWFIAPVALTTQLILLKRTQHSAFTLGWVFGIGWFGAGISWVHVSISQFGGIPLIASVAMMLTLCGYLALYPAIAFYVTRKYVNPNHWYWSLPAIWFITEWIRGWFLTGFPWLSLGYTQTLSPLNAWAPLIGETGISLLLLGISAFLCSVVTTNRITAGLKKPAFTLFVSVSLIFGLSTLIKQVHWTQPTKEKTRITMVQGNIKQALRWVPEQDLPTMNKYLSLTEAHWDADVVIWPEAAIPRLEPLAKTYLENLDALAKEHNTGLITGIVNYNFETRDAYNTLMTLGQADSAPSQDEGAYFYGHPNRYEKHHLLPIGEFIPLESWIRGLAPIFDLPMSSFSRGDYVQANLEANGIYFAPAICFEIAFPDQIRANLNHHTNFIITVSNDAWFGRSHGPHQHLEIAQMRALEFGLPVIRATNNGITAFINTNGRVQAQAPQFEDATLTQSIASTTGTTPYRALGNFPLWIFSVIALFFTFRHRQ